MAAASAQYSTGAIIQGPSSRSTIVGPDGSAISSFAPGGQIATEAHTGFVGRTIAPIAPIAPIAAPALYSHAAYAAPGLYGHGLLGRAFFGGYHGLY